MGNNIKDNGSGGLALQITQSARDADLVEESETPENETGVNVDRMAPLRAFAFDGFVLLVDRERVNMEHIIELVEEAANQTTSIYDASKTKVQTAGNGYQVSLNVGKDAGFEQDSDGRNGTETYPAQGVLGIALDWENRVEDEDGERRRDEWTLISRAAKELGGEIQYIRGQQVK